VILTDVVDRVGQREPSFERRGLVVILGGTKPWPEAGDRDRLLGTRRQGLQGERRVGQAAKVEAIGADGHRSAVNEHRYRTLPAGAI